MLMELISVDCFHTGGYLIFPILMGFSRSDYVRNRAHEDLTTKELFLFCYSYIKVIIILLMWTEFLLFEYFHIEEYLDLLTWTELMSTDYFHNRVVLNLLVQMEFLLFNYNHTTILLN